MHLVYPPKFYCNSEKKCDGDVTMVAKFLDHNNGEFLQQQKSNRFRLAKEKL